LSPQASAAQKALAQNLEASRIAFEKDDFRLTTVFANRLMSDALFMEPAIRRQATLAGIFMRDVAFEMIRITQLGSVSTAKAAVRSYVKLILDSAAKGAITSKSYWDVYGQYTNKIRKYGMSEEEQNAYSENVEFTKSAVRFLLDYLSSKTELLYDSRNLILEGVLNECIRIYRVQGAPTEEYVIINLLTYLQRVYNYIRYSQTESDQKVRGSTVKTEILPNIEKILGLYSKEPLDLDESTNPLEKLALLWREYYVRYMEPATPTGSQAERGVELPEETKKKITTAITKDLEKETKTK